MTKGARKPPPSLPFPDILGGEARDGPGGKAPLRRPGPQRPQFFALSTIRPLVIHGIIARSFSPTASI